MKIDNYDYQLLSLDTSVNGNKGGHSNLFLLKDVSSQVEDRTIKFCKSPREYTRPFDVKRLLRFEREITALKSTQQKDYVITLHQEGWHTIDGYNFRYYVMEKATTDLKEYIIDNKIDIQQKVLLCRQIINCLKDLHDMDIYHRDIKPDNILLIGNVWKLADLGLIQFRAEDTNIDHDNELIGPRGWLTPESINKFLTYNIDTEFKHNCILDDKSDIFQLGLVLWFIFQCNVPVGRIHRNDFLIKDDAIYAILIWMLNHNKSRRPEIYELENGFTVIANKYAA